MFVQQLRSQQQWQWPRQRQQIIKAQQAMSQQRVASSEFSKCFSSLDFDVLEEIFSDLSERECHALSSFVDQRTRDTICDAHKGTLLIAEHGGAANLHFTEGDGWQHHQLPQTLWQATACEFLSRPKERVASGGKRVRSPRMWRSAKIRGTEKHGGFALQQPGLLEDGRMIDAASHWCISTLSRDELREVRELELSEFVHAVPYVAQLEKLEKLDVAAKELGDIPDEIFDLKNLRQLGIFAKSCNVPASIENAKRVERLTLQCTELLELPQELGKLENLRFLRLDCPLLKSSLSFINTLTEIEELELRVSTNGELDIDFSKLKKLRKLVVHSGTLRALPSSLGEATSLEFIDVGSSILSLSLPSFEDLSSLTKLQRLRVNWRDFPIPSVSAKSFVGLKKLSTLIKWWDLEIVKDNASGLTQLSIHPSATAKNWVWAATYELASVMSVVQKLQLQPSSSFAYPSTSINLVVVETLNTINDVAASVAVRKQVVNSEVWNMLSTAFEFKARANFASVDDNAADLVPVVVDLSDVE
uniref:Uncharacterized protein n=1 Tax=Palpitomonas bilix TaxID=652834 RepID=A0A7S3D006_9EUKA|mmetsp:Transcript_15630/g.39661  ORF Transcript_15630/g.39661 Transcript_15630/m.39661 type:complete len:532 (+) Transcript_15630:80-1675(+)